MFCTASKNYFPAHSVWSITKLCIPIRSSVGRAGVVDPPTTKKALSSKCANFQQKMSSDTRVVYEAKLGILTFETFHRLSPYFRSRRIHPWPAPPPIQLRIRVVLHYTKKDGKIIFGASVYYTCMKWPIGASTTMQHLIGMPGMKSHHYTTILFLVATKGRLYATFYRE